MPVSLFYPRSLTVFVDSVDYNCLVFLSSQLIEAMPIMKKHSGRSGILQVFDKLVEEIGSPVDFELPEWLNKWKPTPYSFIRRNVYLAKKVKRRPEDDGIFCSCSSMAGSSGVCGRDCLCGMLRSSCSSACNCGISCVNKPFHQRPVKKMKTVETEKCGLGVVAEEDINQGDFVIEYVGEVIDDKTCEERLWKMKHRGETNFYLCEINRDMVIDASYKGNKSRYINHSCCPNTEMQKWMIDGETRIGIFATRDIEKGEHLTYDYQFVQFGADQDCFCGATGCRKKLGVKPNKVKMPSSDAALKIVACQVAANSPKVKEAQSGKHVHSNGVHAAGGLGRKSVSRRKPRNCIGSVIRIIRSLDMRSFGIIKRFDKTTRRHLIMFDDGSSEFLDLSKEEWEFCNH
ncbi:Histone-lysine N-methyltransferase ASHH3 [Forsythia ovata]|uniref:Histone-lysine N-methyltransferase ASHH3 n=1 Tax=Forsythia ovata TaxID=205694 RepID=A0ABD1T5F2_9LAMI